MTSRSRHEAITDALDEIANTLRDADGARPAYEILGELWDLAYQQGVDACPPTSGPAAQGKAQRRHTVGTRTEGEGMSNDRSPTYEEIAQALVDMTDGIEPHDIANATGLRNSRCVEIQKLGCALIDAYERGEWTPWGRPDVISDDHVHAPQEIKP